MEKFLENNKDNLLKIYQENIKSQGEGILFIDYTQSDNGNVDCSFVPTNKIENFCSKNKYLNYLIVKEAIFKKAPFIIFNKDNIYFLL